MCTRTVTALLTGLILLGCTGEAPDSAAPQTTPPAATTPASEQPESPATTAPAASPTADVVILDASCEVGGDGQHPPVTLRHPAGWEAGGEDIAGCEFFDPEDQDLEPDTEPQGVDLHWSLEPAPFERIAQSDHASTPQRHLAAVVDGHRAVRITATSTGDALLPEGVETTTWVVDLSRSAQGDDTSLVGTTRDVDGVDYDQAVRVLDAMARAVRIGDDDAPEQARSDVTVARAGGRRPFTVAYRGEDGCFELYAGHRQGSRLDRACDLGEPDPLTPTVLRGDGLEVVAGLAAHTVDVVTLRTNSDAQRGAVTVDLGGDRRGFAVPLSGTEASAIAETFAGDELGTVEVLPE